MATTTKTRRKSASRKKATRRTKAAAPRKASASKAPTRQKATSKRKATGKSATAKSKPKTVGGLGASISKAEFDRAAKQLQLKIGSGDKGTAAFELDPREFSSGSFGWFASEKFDVPVGAKKVRCQMSLNVTVIGSKKRG